MDYMDIITENKNLLSNSEQNLKGIFQLLSFFRFHHSYYKENALTYQNKFNEFKNKNVLISSILFNNIQILENSLEKTFSKTVEISNNMEKEIIIHLENFGKSQQNIYQNQINKLNNITNAIKKYTQMLDMIKLNYYKLNYIFKDITIKNQNKEPNEQIKDEIIKLSSQIKSAEYLYKCEIEKYNKQISLYNEQYKTLKKEIKQNEENRINTIKLLMDKYKEIIGELIKNKQEYINLIDKLISSEIIEKDKLLIFNELDKYVQNENSDRLPKHKFLDFLEFTKQFPEEENNIKKEEYILKENNSYFQYKEEQLKTFINKIIDQLMNESNCPIDDIATLFELMKNQKYECDKLFINLFIERKKDNSIKILNLKNLEILGEIFSLIALNNTSIMSKKFELNFLIIFIAERVFHQNKTINSKIYLSSILSKNKYFRTKTFWKNICEVKLALKLEDFIIRMKDLELTNSKQNRFFMKLGTMIGYNDDIYQNSLIKKSGIITLINNYNLVEVNNVPLVDQMASKEMALIIKLNIPKFASFNISSFDSINLISELIKKFNINKEYLNFFQIYSEVSRNTVKRNLSHEIKSYSSFTNVTNEKKNIKLISSSLKYLDKKDYLNIMILSKNINKSFTKKIYNIILKNPKTEIKLRLKIWENYLGISELKKKYNYQEILKSLNDEKLKNDIQKDVIRTYINDSEKTEEIKVKMLNILTSVSTLNGPIQYYQGMNYIVEFLLELTDEENSFYIFLSFFFKTEYYSIFEKDLAKLHHFFYVIQRLIQLYEPEIYSYLISQNVNIDCFISPWFITLFLTSRQYILEKEIPKILIRIMDNLILKGWKSLIKIAIMALHNYEKEILKMKYEEIIQFLITDILKTDFFKNENLENIEKCFENKKIKKKLIKDIEKEFILEQKLTNPQSGIKK